MKNTTEPTEASQEANQAELPKIILIENFLLRQHDYRINTVANELERSPKGKNQFEAVLEEQLTYELFRAGFKGFAAQLAALIRSETIPRADPLAEYFRNLPEWVPGEEPDYIDQLSGYVTTTDPNWFRLQFKKALVRAVACAVEEIPFNKQCLVLAGTQNDGKTSFLRYLCPPALSAYYTEQIDFSSKDAQIALASNFIVNIDELKGLERAEITRLKAFFTTASIKLRRPYDKKDSWAKRKVSFFASTNHEDFLTDETGNVRWLIFKVTAIDHDKGGANGYAAVPINRVWAQAYTLLKSGFDPQLSRAEVEMSETINNMNYFRGTTEIDLIQEYLQPAQRREAGADFLSPTKIIAYLQEKAPTIKNIHPVGVGKALKFLKYLPDQVKINGMPLKGYWVKKIENGDSFLLPYYQNGKLLKEKDLEVVSF